MTERWCPEHEITVRGEVCPLCAAARVGYRDKRRARRKERQARSAWTRRP